MNDFANFSIGDAGVTAILGYLVVFIGLILLMLVVMLVSKLMIKSMAKEKAAESMPAVEPIPEAPKPEAPGTAGELKLYDTDPKDAAMIMAIVADSLGKPLNELRFKSIKEVK